MLIVPTITTNDPVEFALQLEVIAQTSKHAHLDLADGAYTTNILSLPTNLNWPKDVALDVHLMVAAPMEYYDKHLESLNPRLVIVPIETDWDIISLTMSPVLECQGVLFGVSILANQNVADFVHILPYIDHVLIFSGNLGYQGGSTADLELLQKVSQLRALGFGGTIGWDGGVNDQNIIALSGGNIDVVNVGGYIQKSAEPIKAYNKLKSLL
jgi:pentose-5-phosphate-3-epimerase